MHAPEKARKRFSGAISRIASALGTTATLALSAGLVAAGSGAIATRAANVESVAAAPAPLVDVLPIRIESGYEVERAFVGQVEPAQQTALSFENGGTVLEILVDEGDRVEAGQVIARLDIRSLEASRATAVAGREALSAQLELAELTAARQAELKKKGHTATQRYDEARLSAAGLRAQIAATDAEIAGIDVALDKSVLRAPFAGRVGLRSSDAGQIVAPGTGVVVLFEDGISEMRIGLPPDVAASLKPGDLATAQIGESTYTATLSRVRPDLDPATRTRSAYFVLDAGPGNVPPYGQSGLVRLTQTVDEPGAWVPLSALREGLDGTWTVLTAADDGRVALEAVEILHADSSDTYVRGLFEDGTRLIASGPHKLTPGQSIRITE